MKKSALASIICVCSVVVICSIAVPLGMHAVKENNSAETIRKNAKVSIDTNSKLIYTLVEDEDNPANSYWKVGVDTGALRYGNGYTGSAAIITVPDTYEDTENEYGRYPVKAIGENAFSHNSGIQVVNLGSNITQIGLDAFAYCDNLRTVKITNNVEFIDYGAFRGSKKLKTVSVNNQEGINLPTNANFDTLSSFTFAECESIANIISLGSVKTIMNSAFFGDNNIKSLNFAGIEKIGTLAFSGCSNLSGKVDFTGVTAIEQYAFYGCSNIFMFIFKNNLYIGNHAFRGTNAIGAFNTGATCSSKTTQKNWNDGLSSLFENCSINTEILPLADTGLTLRYENISMGGAANGIAYVTDISPADTKVTETAYSQIENELSDKSIYYGESLFDGRLDASFANLSIGNNVTSIGDKCFANNPSITSVSVTNQTESIGKGSFGDCKNIVSMTLPFIGKELDPSNALSAKVTDVFGYIFAETSNNAPTADYYVALQKWKGTNEDVLFAKIPNTLDYITITDEKIINHGAFAELCVKTIDFKQTATYVGQRAFIKYSVTNPSRSWPKKTNCNNQNLTMKYMDHLILRCDSKTQIRGDYCFSTNGGGNNPLKVCVTLTKTEFDKIGKSGNFNGNNAPLYYLNDSTGVNSWSWNADETDANFS